MLPWALADNATLIGRLSALVEFTLVGSTVLAAGAISDDLDDGEYAIALAHDASPLEVLLGQGAASLAFASVLVMLQLPLALVGAASKDIPAISICLVALVVLLAGWLAFMLLLATFLEGKANAIAMIAVLFVPLLLESGLLDRLPRALALTTRHALQLLPQATHATSVFRSVAFRTPIAMDHPVVLVCSPFLYFALASYRLHRLEPAGRLTQ